jgi:hypothetical protein
MRAFATLERRRRQRHSGGHATGLAPSLLGRRNRAVRDILHGSAPGGEFQARLRVHTPGLAAERSIDSRGETAVALPGRQACTKRAAANLDDPDLIKRWAKKRIQGKLPPEVIEHPSGPEGHPSKAPGSPPEAHPLKASTCRYRSLIVSHDDAWRDYPSFSGGGRAGGPFVSPHADWVKGEGIMVHRFLVTIEVDGDPQLCRYQQEKKNYVVRNEGTADQVVDDNTPRRDDTYPKGSPSLRFTDSQIQWMDAPGYPGNLKDTDAPVHQQWTFWYSAWNSDGSGPLVLQLNYDFLAQTADPPGTISYFPGMPASIAP